MAKREGFWSEELSKKIVESGSVHNIEELPDDWKRALVTAHEVTPEWHVKIQAAFQEYIDNAVSKTINFPKEASVENVRDAYRLAYSLGTKGITIYRSGSREKEVIAPVKEKISSSVGSGRLCEAKTCRIDNRMSFSVSSRVPSRSNKNALTFFIGINNIVFSLH